MLSILVVEDEAPIRDWVAYTVNNICNDFRVVATASNGKEGYKLAMELKPHVIISDIKMPIMNGIELTKQVKKIIEDTYVILLTNYEEFSYAKEAISSGVYEYLIKSDIRPKDLKDVLSSIYEKINKEKNILNKEEYNIEEKEISKEYKYSTAIYRSMEYIKNHYKESISLSDISKYVYLSPEYFSRLFKKEVGENFSSYLTIYRMKKAENLLRNTDMKICQISNEVGYSNSGYFSKAYKKYKGVSPEEDRY